MNSLFGPLGKKYCNLFLIISAIALFFVVMTVVGVLLLFTDKKLNKMAVISGLLLAGVYVIQYVQNRILYNMCKSI
jgi:hypothetical protein